MGGRHSRGGQKSDKKSTDDPPLRQLGELALTPADFLTAMEGLNEQRWSAVGYWLGVPSTLLETIEDDHSEFSDRLTVVFEYFLELDPDVSWRSVMRALDYANEERLALQLHHLAEPVTDPTFTVEAVATVIETVKDWSRLSYNLEIPDSVTQRIQEKHHKSEQHTKHAEYIVKLQQGASWETLAGALYCISEEGALEAARSYVQKEKDPTLTLPNLVSLVEGVISWRVNLGERLRVPFLKLHEIDMNSLSKPEKKEVMLKEWLENHPAPSWMGVARSLYRSAGLPEHAALRSMYGKYLKARKSQGVVKTAAVDPSQIGTSV